MDTKWLFPHQYRLAGWLIVIPSVVLGLFVLYGEYTIDWLSIGSPTALLPTNFTDELASLGTIIGLLLIAFSREKIEDERMGRLRLEALQWSVYINYLILIVAVLITYDGVFFSMMIYNMFTVLLVFIGRFRWLIHRDTQQLTA